MNSKIERQFYVLTGQGMVTWNNFDLVVVEPDVAENPKAFTTEEHVGIVYEGHLCCGATGVA